MSMLGEHPAKVEARSRLANSTLVVEHCNLRSHIFPLAGEATGLNDRSKGLVDASLLVMQLLHRGAGRVRNWRSSSVSVVVSFATVQPGTADRNDGGAPQVGRPVDEGPQTSKAGEPVCYLGRVIVHVAPAALTMLALEPDECCADCAAEMGLRHPDERQSWRERVKETRQHWTHGAPGHPCERGHRDVCPAAMLAVDLA
jgi:hypothetical protein